MIDSEGINEKVIFVDLDYFAKKGKLSDLSLLKRLAKKNILVGFGNERVVNIIDELFNYDLFTAVIKYEGKYDDARDMLIKEIDHIIEENNLHDDALIFSNKPDLLNELSISKFRKLNIKKKFLII